MRTKPRHKQTGYRLRVFYLAEKMSDLLWECINSRVKKALDSQQNELLHLLKQSSDSLSSSNSSVESFQKLEKTSSGFNEPLLTPPPPPSSADDNEQNSEVMAVDEATPQEETVVEKQSQLASHSENERFSEVKL